MPLMISGNMLTINPFDLVVVGTIGITIGYTAWFVLGVFLQKDDDDDI